MLGRSKTLRQKRGQQAEAQALKFLTRQGLRLIEKNFTCRVGELDLIMKDRQGTLIFVEVRARESQAYGGAAASVTRGKQQKVVRAAQTFLQQNGLGDVACRFDVIAFEDQAPHWIQAAFSD